MEVLGKGERSSNTTSDGFRTGAVRRNPVSQACDACRNRKVRCEQRLRKDVDSGSTSAADELCRRCTKFGLECTFLLPVKTRGPVSRRKQSISQASTPARISGREGRLSQSSHITNSSISPTIHISSPTVSPSSQQRHFSFSSSHVPLPSPASHHPEPVHQPLDSRNLERWTSYPTDVLGDRGVIREILSDYFQYLYPVIPVVHRPSFQRDIINDRDRVDADFLGLIYALCALTVAIIPSKFEKYQRLTVPPYADRKGLVYACYDEFLRWRSHEYFDDITYMKWAAHYVLSIGFLHVADYNRSRMIGVETNQLGRSLNLHKISEYSKLNCIEIQLRKKAFWLTFYSFVHGQLHFVRKERTTFIDAADACRLPFKALMPDEVDDEYIHEHAILPQPPGTLSLATGFNLASYVFLAAYTSGHSTEPCPCVRAKDLHLQIQHLQQRLNDLKYLLDDIPAPLQPWAAIEEETSPMNGSGMDELHSRRVLHGQYATLRANLHVTHLWFQNLLSTQLDALLESRLSESDPSLPPLLQPRDVKVVWAEREDLCRQLLHLLHGLSNVHIEPNGLVIVSKIREIAITLLSVPPGLDAGAERRAATYLRAFADILSKLDGEGYNGILSLERWVDGDEI